jgi:hypothetical protein
MLASSAYNLLSSVVGVFALLYLARGLEGARRFEGGFGRRIGIALLIAALVTIGVAAVGYLRMPINDVVGGPILIGLSLLVSAATLVATVYLTTIAHAGRQAGEDPATGWALAASYGYVTILATLVIVGINRRLDRVGDRVRLRRRDRGRGVALAGGVRPRVAIDRAHRRRRRRHRRR